MSESQETINWHEYFTYEPVAGKLFWRERPRSHFKSDGAWKVFNTRMSNKPAGYRSVGRILVNVRGKMRQAYRIIWEMHKPPLKNGECIDHWDMDVTNDRLENLRLSNKSTNGMNRPYNKNNAHHLKGVSLDKRDGVYSAEIMVNRKRISLGRHKTKGLAALAYAKGSLMHHGRFSPFYKPA